MASSINLMVVAGIHHYDHNIHLFVMHAHHQTQHTISKDHTLSLSHTQGKPTTHTHTHTHKNTCSFYNVARYSHSLLHIHQKIGKHKNWSTTLLNQIFLEKSQIKLPTKSSIAFLHKKV